MLTGLIGAGGRAILRMPERLLRALAGPEVRSDRGAALDLQAQALIRVSELLRFPRPHQQSPARARISMDRQVRMLEPAPPAVARVVERTVPGPARPIPVRIYAPRQTAEPLPVLVYYHGGGHSVGSLDSHDGPCRALATGGDCLVASVDYRLAPEHRFPAALEDAAAAFEGLAEQAPSFGGDPERVAVGGDSAGGNLAAAVCQRQRDAARRRPSFQLLIYPATDLTRAHPSHRRFARGFLLDAETKAWFVDNYMGGGDLGDPRASPLLASRFDVLPPALVVTAGFDPLRDEGEAYAAALRAAGVEVAEHHEPSLVHGFINMPAVARARRARAEIARALGAALRASPSAAPADLPLAR